MSLQSYSGITTKVRAMQSRLLSEEQFRALASVEDVRSAADYLKQLPAYSDIFSDLDDTRLHRGYLEQLLTQSEYRDFAKLYRFANLSQRQFLNLYFMHYEINVIKQILRNVLGTQKNDVDLSLFQEFFNRHSSLNLSALCQAGSLEELIAGLEGTVYYLPLTKLAEQGNRSLFDFETALDLYYFRSVWSIKQKVLSKKEQQILNECFGCRLDLLNIQWIYRSKKFYHLPAADIYALLIPVHYRLRKEQISRLAEAATLEEFFAALQGTCYGGMEREQLTDKPDLELLSHQIMNRIYTKTGSRHPYSIAILDSYLYFKELEMRRIITIIEGVRYGLKPEDIMALAIKQ